MSRHTNKKSRLKYVFLAFTCATAFAFSGIASACGNNTDEETDKPATKEDTQLLKNGNFEFFTIPEKKEDGNEPEYLIKSVENWSHGGTNSYTMSGIISTSEASWAKLSDEGLKSKLDYNNELDSSLSYYKDEYIDYNGMKSSDILYKDQYKALKEDSDYKEGEEIPADRFDRIENPGTHYNVTKEGDKLYALVDGEKKEVFVDDKGEYFLEDKNDKGEYGTPISNVLMLHNYATAHNGIAQNYSSVEVELPANTAAEISVWVKTAYLKHNQGKEVEQDRGAYISVIQTVGSSTLDNFTISCINTEKLLGLRDYPEAEKAIDKDEYNGWVEYTVYVNACDFATTKIKLELGLGETGYSTEGYAFFDDVSVTKYADLSDEDCSYTENKAKLTADTTCVLSTDASEKVKKADSWQRNGGNVDPRFSKNFYYLIDLASEMSEGSKDDTYSYVDFTKAENLTAGLTVDDDNYVSSKRVDYTALNVTGPTGYDEYRLPFNSGLKDKGLDTEGDLLAIVTAKEENIFTGVQYADKLNEALKGAVKLPKNNKTNQNNMLVMLSAYGAAYTTSFTLSVPRSGSEYDGYQIVSFWVKTSDMGGNTAATVTITQEDNDENTASFTIDTTGKVTNIGKEEGEKDIYDGWVQCFFFVKNEIEGDDKTADNYTVEFSFGNTSIKGTDSYSYKSGWVALANMQVLNVDEDIFSYTGSGDSTASLTISEEADKYTKEFDSAYASQSQQIKKDMVNASSYKGVNGSSSAVVNNGHVSIPFDEFNHNVDENGKTFTGLINKEYFVDGNYDNEDNSWFEHLLKSFNLYESYNTSAIDATGAWNKIFGEKSYQPLVITNKTRTSYVELQTANASNFKEYYVKNDDGDIVPVSSLDDPEFDETKTYYNKKQVMNYGYIGDDKQVSADSYSTISVRVKASANAVAYVYLVDTSAGKNLLSFNAPDYSFYYDVEGNVLKAKPKDNATVVEQRANILYTLRDDGLYEDANGTLYANLWNYGKLYYENIEYFDENGKSHNIDNLVDGETYYTDKEHHNEANHYLVTESGVKVYHYKNGTYHYIVDGKTQSETVLTFDKQYARYDFSKVSEDYMVRIEGPTDDWVTVNFVVHAGSNAKSYRLELWSGERELTGVGDEADAKSKEGGTVIFDYSYTSISSDDAKSLYEQDIIDAYLDAFEDADLLDKLAIDTTNKNIKFYEDLAEEYEIKVDVNYKAYYYTYSLYDSADYKPFNKEVAAEGATGYDYSAADQSETLAYLQVRDGDAYNVFVDYSAIDKSVTLNDTTNNDTDNKDEDDKKNSDGSIWLLASSIILVVALIFAIIAIFLKDALKKARRNKVTSKNNYDQRKANRYKRKLHLQQEAIEVDANESADSEPEAEAEAEEPAEEVPEITEDLVEEAPEAEAEVSSEEAVESVPETTEAEEPADEANEAGDDSDKQE